MHPILIFDSKLSYIAQIDDYQYLRWTRKWRRTHTFEIRVNRHKNNAQYLTEDNFIAIFKGGAWRAGIIEHKEIELTEEGKISENWTIVGRSYGMFDDRLALHLTTTGNGYDTQRANAETVMRHFVNVNCINPVDNNRIVPYLKLGNDLGRGQVIDVRARFQTISDLLESCSITSGLGYEVVFDLNDKQFYFNVLEGRDLTPSQNINPPVIFSPEFDNVNVLGYRYSKIDSKNFAVVAGQGEAESRLIAYVSNNSTGINRREIFVDARDLETSQQLIQRGEARLAELIEEVVMEVYYIPGGPFSYPQDFDLGDIIHARYPEIGSLDSRIIEVVEETTPEQGDVYRISLGKEYPDLINVLKLDKKNVETEVRK